MPAVALSAAAVLPDAPDEWPPPADQCLKPIGAGGKPDRQPDAAQVVDSVSHRRDIRRASRFAVGARRTGRARSPVEGSADPIGRRAPSGLPCQIHDPDLWFAEAPDVLELAKTLCGGCPAQQMCLAGALERREPFGVWGGQIFQRGRIVDRKRPPGRPRKDSVPVLVWG